MKTRRALRVARMLHMLHDEGGAALLEFALVAIILLILVFGMIDFGRAVYTKNSITHAAREGGRYAAVLESPVTSETAIIDQVVARMSPFGGGPLQADDVTVVMDPPGNPQPQSITIGINYPFRPITPLARLIGLSTMTLRASAQFRWERGGT